MSIASYCMSLLFNPFISPSVCIVPSGSIAVVSAKKALDFCQKASLPSRGAAWLFLNSEFQTAVCVDFNAFHLLTKTTLGPVAKKSVGSFSGKV